MLFHRSHAPAWEQETRTLQLLPWTIWIKTKDAGLDPPRWSVNTLRSHAGAWERWEAVPFSERLILWGEREDFDRWISYEEKMFTLYAYDSLATCHFRLERYSESEKYFKLARQYSTDPAEYDAKAALSALRKTSLVRTVSTSAQ